MDIPLGGGKGGIICNPKEMSQGELERLSRAYVRQVGRILGLEMDVPAPDVYTTPQIMAWMIDEYSMMQGYNEFGVITGKPLALGGSKGRDDATARGGMYCMREAASVLGINLRARRWRSRVSATPVSLPRMLGPEAARVRGRRGLAIRRAAFITPKGLNPAGGDRVQEEDRLGGRFPGRAADLQCRTCWSWPWTSWFPRRWKT